MKASVNNIEYEKTGITFIQLVKVLYAALGPQIREWSNIGPAGISSPSANLSIYGVEGGNINNNLPTASRQNIKYMNFCILVVRYGPYLYRFHTSSKSKSNTELHRDPWMMALYPCPQFLFSFACPFDSGRSIYLSVHRLEVDTSSYQVHPEWNCMPINNSYIRIVEIDFENNSIEYSNFKHNETFLATNEKSWYQPVHPVWEYLDYWNPW